MDERVALVTGAGQGVGRAIALALARQGAKIVIVNDYVEERARRVAEEVAAMDIGVQGVPYQANVSLWTDVTRMIDDVGSKFGSVDVLVNNAGNAGQTVEDVIGWSREFVETDPDHWRAWVDVNFLAPMYMTRAVLPHMIRHEWGRIINVISEAGRVGEPRLVVYSGAKAGTAGFSRALAKEVGRYRITVNCVALGTIDTPSVSSVVGDATLLKKMSARYPLKRIGQPEDVSGLVAFLASDNASWITGQTYGVNGGYATLP
ncbi:MAG: oxidoreductase [Sulfobacillus acidophilus]|uniref:Oxidoreductase n=1 Tax=Sulfobacillus acidophilus TaxID=53633 RepID=A0A2T2WL08_9FIRM|nr:MAG: oxidoreductase [Sulfobacillus acidophilus]